jgi:hypothetical protein
VTTALASFVLLAQPQITFSGGEFTIKDGAETFTVPLSAAQPPPKLSGDRLNIRIGDTLITFDQRGLGIQYRAKGGFTHLPYIATSPNLFDTDEINRIKGLIALNVRFANVSALSGFELVGERLHLLMRWEEKSGAPWLEALVDVDTSGDTPKVNVLARFDGFSFATNKAADELYSRGTQLIVPIKSTRGVGLGIYDTGDKSSRSLDLGPLVDACTPLGNRFYTVSQTTHGMTAIGLLDPKAERWRPLYETRGKVVPTSLTGALRIREQSTDLLYAATSGARLDIGTDSAVAQTPYGVLVWSPADKPTQAELREADTWLVLAEWKR